MFAVLGWLLEKCPIIRATGCHYTPIFNISKFQHWSESWWRWIHSTNTLADIIHLIRPLITTPHQATWSVQTAPFDTLVEVGRVPAVDKQLGRHVKHINTFEKQRWMIVYCQCCLIRWVRAETLFVDKCCSRCRTRIDKWSKIVDMVCAFLVHLSNVLIYP